MTVIVDIDKMIASFGPMPDPFNGATHVVLSVRLFAALAPHLDLWRRDPLLKLHPQIEIRHELPAGYGIGYRAWQKGDDPDTKFYNKAVVWFCGTKDEKELSNEGPNG